MRMVAHVVLTIGALASSLGMGQTIMVPNDRAKFDTAFDQLKSDPLKCNTSSVEPSLDFGFRFELRYRVDCEVKQFGGVAGELKVFLRVRPEVGAEVVLGDRFAIPAAPAPMLPAYARKTTAKLEFSGVLAAGTGVYTMELLLIDSRERIYRHHWKAKVFSHGREQNLHLAMPPNTLAPLRSMPIPLSAGGNGGPLTVLVNAAPLNPQSLKLRAWDRAFLLDSLSSLLRQLSYSSVRVIAFNLEQQHEIFRQDNFTQADMRNLGHALRMLELGTISYRTLERKRGWAELLIGLLKEEVEAERPADAIVFLGPTLRLEEKIPAEMLVSHAPQTPRLFCVAYYPNIGADFPDSIQLLTTALKGKVFRIHSPAELAQNLEKLQREIEGDTAARAMRMVK
jgi:hypothetical protein